MDSDSKQLRRAAANAFMEALDQLAMSLQPIETPDDSGNAAVLQGASGNPGISDGTGQALAEAAADIEQYLRQQAQNRCR